jgi:hypothetical protein
MWNADEAWRASLRAVTLVMLVQILEKDIPPALWRESFEWVMKRVG